jgi:hypothetical protein
MIKRLCRGVILTSFILGSGCSALPPDCGNDRPYSGNDRYCDIPRIATNFYREHIFYNVYTYPEIYFESLAKNPKKDRINILALGDSWFAYPKSNWLYFDIFTPPANVLTNLSSLKHPSTKILSLSNAGELVTNIAGIADQDPLEMVEIIQREYSVPWATVRALRRMNDDSVTNNQFDYVLISGGGNDFFYSRIKKILGNKPCEDPGHAAEKCFDQKELDAVISRLRDAYVALIEMILAEAKHDLKKPGPKIVTHTYDFIHPMPIGAKLVYGMVEKGSYGWFYPALEELRITDRREQKKITDKFLSAFQIMLLRLADNPQYSKHFIVVPTQGVLTDKLPVEDYWLNEIHPTSKGFLCISETIHQAIRHDLRAQGRLDAYEAEHPKYECIQSDVSSRK